MDRYASFIKKHNPKLEEMSIFYGFNTQYGYKELFFNTSDQDVDIYEYINFILSHLNEKELYTISYVLYKVCKVLGY